MEEDDGDSIPADGDDDATFLGFGIIIDPLDVSYYCCSKPIIVRLIIL